MSVPLTRILHEAGDWYVWHLFFLLHCCHCSVARSCPTLCDSINCSMPGLIKLCWMWINKESEYLLLWPYYNSWTWPKQRDFRSCACFICDTVAMKSGFLTWKSISSTERKAGAGKREVPEVHGLILNYGTTLLCAYLNKEDMNS